MIVSMQINNTLINNASISRNSTGLAVVLSNLLCNNYHSAKYSGICLWS